MVDLQLALPANFLEEETRCDYLVSRQMKEIWAVEMDLLRQLDHVCSSLGIRYFACGGTLLGAVRHQGFIPWDDDIDVAMLREDYVKLCQAYTQFQKPYELQYFDVTEGYFTGHAQLRNTQTTGALKMFLDAKSKMSYNQGIFIDIFPLDAIPDDKAARDALIEKVQLLRKKAKRAYRLKDGYLPEKADLKRKLTHILYRMIPNQPSYKELYQEFLKTCTQYNGQKTEYVTMLSFMPENEKLWIKREDLEEIIDTPFEFITIPVEKHYDKVLKTQYGDYMVPVKGGCYHGDVFFDTDLPYEEWKKTHTK